MRLDTTLLTALAALSLAACAGDTTPCTAGHHSGSECALRIDPDAPAGDPNAVHPTHPTSAYVSPDDVAGEGPIERDPCPGCGRG